MKIVLHAGKREDDLIKSDGDDGRSERENEGRGRPTYAPRVEAQVKSPLTWTREPRPHAIKSKPCLIEQPYSKRSRTGNDLGCSASSQRIFAQNCNHGRLTLV